MSRVQVALGSIIVGGLIVSSVLLDESPRLSSGLQYITGISTSLLLGMLS